MDWNINNPLIKNTFWSYFYYRYFANMVNTDTSTHQKSKLDVYQKMDQIDL